MKVSLTFQGEELRFEAKPESEPERRMLAILAEHQLHAAVNLRPAMFAVGDPVSIVITKAPPAPEAAS